MDQKLKSKNKLLKFLPKAASAVVSFQNNLPFSPNREKRSSNDPNKPNHKTHIGIISLIPPQARLKTKNSAFETQEPTSPKISCMGQIKSKKDVRVVSSQKDKDKDKDKDAKPKMKRFASFSVLQQSKPKPSMTKNSTVREEPTKKKNSAIMNVFKGKPSGRKSDAAISTAAAANINEKFKLKPPACDNNMAPVLGQMKKFASGRDTFSGFDWTAQIAPVDRNCYSDDDRGDSDNEDDDVFPKLQPRKEVNLWKRRTMDRPKPLQLNTM